jgi:methyl-accepting chemotaxis protein
MNTNIRKIFSITLMVLAAISVLISLAILVQVWRLKSPAMHRITSALELVGDTLETTAQGLEIAQSSLNSASASAEGLVSTLEGLSKTLSDTAPMIVSIEDLFRDELPSTIRATQDSLTTAQASAKIIDNVLKVVSAIPFVTLQYNPEVPLHVALGDISDNIDELPGKFSDLEDGLKKTRQNLIATRVDLNQIAADAGDISGDLQAAEDVVRDYRSTIREVQSGLRTIINQIPTWLNYLAWFITFIIIWLTITQLSLFLQGWDMLHRE